LQLLKIVVEDGNAANRQKQEANVPSCLQLVSRQHPKLDARLSNANDGASAVLLQFVFNRCCTKDLKTTFDLLCTSFQLEISVSDGQLRLSVRVQLFLGASLLIDIIALRHLLKILAHRQLDA
jgi:hypothetical protein